MNKLPIVDIYCRVACLAQGDMTSFDEQEAAGRHYCHEHGLVVSMVHREHCSGFQYNDRQHLELLRSRYRNGSIQGVVIRMLDRLSRSRAYTAMLTEEMARYGVKLYCIEGNIANDPILTLYRQALQRIHKESSL